MPGVKYKNHKDAMPVNFPIGARSLSEISQVRFADPYLEMSDEDALKLVELDPYNFELWDGSKPGKPGTNTGTEIHAVDTQEIPMDDVFAPTSGEVTEPKQAKRGRKPKA